jgi:hypothetical protein
MMLPLLSGNADRPSGDSGTKVLAMPPAPVVPAQRAAAGMPLPPGPSGLPGRRRLSQRRLLVGALGATALAAAVVGVLSTHSTAGGTATPVMSTPVEAAPVPPVLRTQPPPASDSGVPSQDSQVSSQDAKRAKQEAKKAKEALKKANQKASDSSSTGSGSSSSTGSGSSSSTDPGSSSSE